MSKGWIYLKKMTDHNGTPTAYCFGLTSRPKKRKKAYRKENPFIVHLEDFKTDNMKAAEDELIAEAKRRRWLLRDNSDEWIKESCFEDFKIIWERVKSKHSVQGAQKRKVAKRKRRQSVRGMNGREIERQRQLPAGFINSIRAESALANKMMAARQQEKYSQPTQAVERQDKVATQPVFVEQTKGGIPADLLFGIGVFAALPALVMLVYFFIAVSYAVKGILAFWFQFGIPLLIIAVGIAACVFIWRYGMNAAAECGEI